MECLQNELLKQYNQLWKKINSMNHFYQIAQLQY